MAACAPIGTISNPPAGGTVTDQDSGASVTVPPGVLSEPTDVTIYVLDPGGFTPPDGFTASGTLFAQIDLRPEPSYPLPAPGLTLVLPLRQSLPPNRELQLWRVNPGGCELEAVVGLTGPPVVGTVNP